MLIAQTVVALVLIVALIAILAYAMFKGIPAGSLRIARFLAALCAGIAAFLIPGSALFQLSQDLSTGGSLVIKGTAGVALFLIVFLGWGKIPQPAGTAPQPTATSLTLPKGINFKSAALQLAQLDSCVADLNHFSQDEQDALLQQDLSLSRPVNEALAALGSGVWSSPIHAYKVSRNGGAYVLA